MEWKDPHSVKPAKGHCEVIHLEEEQSIKLVLCNGYQVLGTLKMTYNEWERLSAKVKKLIKEQDQTVKP